MINFLKTAGIGLMILLGASTPTAMIDTPIELAPMEYGATNPVAGTNYYLAGSGVSAAATSITLTSLTIPQTGYELQDSDFSDTFYLTLEPGNRTKQEIASCTTVTQNANNTATLSGCTRGLLPFTPFTASSSYAFPHGGGTAVVFSNPPQLYEEFAGTGNPETITGVWTFASTSIPRQDSYLAPTLATQFSPKGYVDSVVTAGGVPADTSTPGISILATPVQTSLGTATSSYSGQEYTLVPQNSLFNTTSTATTTVPVTKSNGKLSQGFLDLTEPFTFSGGVTSTGSSLFSGTSTFTGPVIGLPKIFGNGSSGDVTISATTTLSSDMFYSNLTVNSGISLNTNGYRIYVSGTLTNNGIIHNNGSNGGNGSGISGGVAPSQSNSTSSICMPTSGLSGANGPSNTGSNLAGNNAATTTSITTLGVGNVKAGDGGAASLAGGLGGTTTTITADKLFSQFAINSSIFANATTSGWGVLVPVAPASSSLEYLLKTSLPGNGGGSGGQDTNTNGSGGGGGGSGGNSGGCVFLGVHNLINNGVISSNGGNGGNGGNGVSNSNVKVGGGGAGSGGSGGVIILFYDLFSGSGSLLVNPGVSGSVGSGGSGGSNGTLGNTGLPGNIYRMINQL